MREGLVERRPGKGVYVRRPEAVTRRIQLIVPDLAYDVCARLVKGAQEAGRRRGVQIQVCNAQKDVQQDIELIEQLPQSFADGAILISVNHPQFTEAIFKLKLARYPLVLSDEQWIDSTVPTVCSDNYQGGYEVGKRLIALGHRRIGFIGSEPTLPPSAVQRRLEGLRDAIADAALPFDRTLVAMPSVDPFADWSEPIGRATRQIMQHSEPPTALFYSCDGAAAWGYRALKEMNWVVGRDVSVVGFDDEPLCKVLDPPLTTMRSPQEQVGAAALEMLLDQLSPTWAAPSSASSAAQAQALHRRLPCQWIERQSARAVP